MIHYFRNLSISRKLSIAFGLVFTLCLIQGIASLVGLTRINSLTTDVTTHVMPTTNLAFEMRNHLQTIRRLEILTLNCKDAACLNSYNQRHATAVDKFNDARDKLIATIQIPENRAALDRANDAYKDYYEQSSLILKDANSGQFTEEELEKREHALLPMFNKTFDLNTELANKLSQLGVQDGERINTTNTFLRSLSLGITVLVGICCIAIGISLTRSIAPPLAEATLALERIAEKDLTAQVSYSSEDEVGRMAKALNTTILSIREVLQSVAHSAETLSSAATELSVRSSQTSSNAHIQTDKTNQIAAASQEMSATIGEISHNAEAASVAGRQSAELATQGGAVMQNAATTMEKIASTTQTVSESMGELARRSQEIGRVITVIQEISEQTNLLALNAAIEAARAGEHGRGFAVVAGEVRRLAERTKGATEEIGSTIGAIQRETSATMEMMSSSRESVENGLSEASNARSSLDMIIQSSKEVEHQIHLIASAATEQTAASYEIAESATQISGLSAENGQAAQEIEMACKNLSELAADQDRMIRQFRLD